MAQENIKFVKSTTVSSRDRFVEEMDFSREERWWFRNLPDEVQEAVMARSEK